MSALGVLTAHLFTYQVYAIYSAMIWLLSFRLDVVLRMEMWMPNTERANTSSSLHLQLRQWTWNTTSYKNQNKYKFDYISNIVSYHHAHCHPTPITKKQQCVFSKLEAIRFFLLKLSFKHPDFMFLMFALPPQLEYNVLKNKNCLFLISLQFLIQFSLVKW